MGGSASGQSRATPPATAHPCKAKAEIASRITGFSVSSPFGADIRKRLRHGIGLHHAGLLPKYRVRVEQLAQAGLPRVICGTDTLGITFAPFR